jgi:hypothetical protein
MMVKHVGTKHVGAILHAKSNGASATTTVPEKRVRYTAGQVKRLRVLDIGSRTFGDDLEFVFGKNVAKARRDNKRIIGTPDVVPKR